MAFVRSGHHDDRVFDRVDYLFRHGVEQHPFGRAFDILAVAALYLGAAGLEDCQEGDGKVILAQVLQTLPGEIRKRILNFDQRGGCGLYDFCRCFVNGCFSHDYFTFGSFNAAFLNS